MKFVNISVKYDMSRLFLSIAIFAFIFMSTTNGQIAGGLGASKPANDDVNQLVERLKPEILKKICDLAKDSCPSSDVKIVVNNYKSQVVAGTNYFINADVGEETYHFRIFSQPWTNTEEVHGVQGPKQKTEEVTYF